MIKIKKKWIKVNQPKVVIRIEIKKKRNPKIDHQKAAKRKIKKKKRNQKMINQKIERGVKIKVLKKKERKNGNDLQDFHLIVLAQKGI